MPERSPLERSPLERWLRAECASPARVTPHHPTHADSFTHSASVLVRTCRAAARFRDHNAGVTVTVSLHALAKLATAAAGCRPCIGVRSGMCAVTPRVHMHKRCGAVFAAV